MPADADECRPLVTVITPAYNEEANLPLLYERLAAVFAGLAEDWEWIIVDDHSADSTFAVAGELAARDARVRGIRFSRNFGSHMARTCGLHHAAGDCAIAMAADLQDPPERIPDLLARWREGAHVVSAVRTGRPGEKASTRLFSRLYYWIVRDLAGVRMPSAGASFHLLDRRAIDAYCRFPERHVNAIILVHWLGFRHEHIQYEQQARLHGRSGWTLAKKLKLLIDTLAAFSDLPVRAAWLGGAVLAFAGGTAGAVLAALAVTGRPVSGWAVVIAAMLMISGVQLLVLAFLGEYLWRALDEARRRPQYLIEDAVGTPLARRPER